MARRIFVVIFLSLVMGAGIWFFQIVKANNVGNAPIVSAVGGQWAVQDLAWHEWDGAWRVEATFFPDRVWKLDNETTRSVLQSFCGAILTSLPGKPDEVEGRKEVYRVDLNAMLFPSKSKERALMHPIGFPVQVTDGACKLPDGDNFVFYATYPGVLAGWELQLIALKQDEGNTVAVVVFARGSDAAPNQEVFAYLKACQAVMADPLVMSHFLEHVEQENPELRIEDASEVKVYVRDPYGVEQGAYWETKNGYFALTNGTCVKVPDGEAI